MAIVESIDHRMETHEFTMDGMPVFGLKAVIEENRTEYVAEPERKTIPELTGELLVQQTVDVLTDPQ